MFVALQLTLPALLLLFVTRHASLIPFVVANSAVGFGYMVLEWEALRDVGSCSLGYRFRVAPGWNLGINVLTHLILPSIILWRTRVGRVNLASILAFVAGVLLLIDIRAVYPCRVVPLVQYAALYGLIVAFTTFCLWAARPLRDSDDTKED